MKNMQIGIISALCVLALGRDEHDGDWMLFPPQD
jgi:hypothetical protein